MKIIIPMAGEGKRFSSEGFVTPKFMLVANGKTFLEWALSTFEDLFCTHEFVFVAQKGFLRFIESIILKLGVKKYKIVEIDHRTKGQAESVLMALDKCEDNEILIFNSDTLIKEKFFDYFHVKDRDGWWLTFKQEGDHWSFARVDNSLIVEVSEKKRISDNASTGMYYFKSSKVFFRIYERYHHEISCKYKEVYVAPMYQYLIDDGGAVSFYSIDKAKVVPLGTPGEGLIFDPFLYENNR